MQWIYRTLFSSESNTYAVICTVNSLLTDNSLKPTPSLARALVPAFIYSWVSPPRRSSSNLVPRSPTAKGKGQDRVRSGYEINILRLRPWLSKHRGKTSTHAPGWAFPVSFAVTLSSQIKVSRALSASFCVQLVVQLFCFMLLVFLTIL